MDPLGHLNATEIVKVQRLTATTGSDKDWLITDESGERAGSQGRLADQRGGEGGTRQNCRGFLKEHSRLRDGRSASASLIRSGDVSTFFGRIARVNPSLMLEFMTQSIRKRSTLPIFPIW
jgi:hypothetical protein